jgi:hypothetical protein
VKAITKASGQPLNVAISSDDDNTVAIPPLRLRGVNVVSVLNAVSGASARSTRVQVSGNAYDYRQTGYRFTPFGGEPVTPSTVWYFQRQNPLETEKVCRFYQLSPYLKEHSVESITTAIGTGWKMMGIPNPPTMEFHKDTGLLIAVGQLEHLLVIDQVLANLEKAKPPAAKADGQ